MCLLAKCPLDDSNQFSGYIGKVHERYDHDELIVTDIQFNMDFLLGRDFKDGKEYKGNSNIIDAFKELIKKTFGEYNPKTGKFNFYKLFMRVEGNVKNGQLFARVDAPVWKLMRDMKMPYNKIDIKIVSRLQGVNDIQAYERFCSLDRPITYTIDTYRKLTGCENLYPDVHDFLKWTLIEPLKKIAEEGKIIPYTINKASKAKTSPIVSFTVYPETNSKKIKNDIKRYGPSKYFSTEEILTMEKYFSTDEIINSVTTFLSVKWYNQENLVKLIDKYFKDATKNNCEPKSWIISNLKRIAIEWN